MPDIWGLSSIAFKFLLYVGVLTSVGLVLCRLIFASRFAELDRVTRASAFVLAVLALLAAVIGFALRGAVLLDDVSGMTDPAILSLLWDTQPGDVLLLRGVGLATLALGVCIGGPALFVALVGGLVALWSFAEIGHIASQDRIWVQIVLFAHLSAAAFWIGIFIPLRSLALADGKLNEAAVLGEQFGRIATAIVPLLILAGLAMTWWLVGSISATIGTSYGQMLLIKVAIVGGLLTLALMNKTRFVPAMQRGEGRAGVQLARAITIEGGCVALILMATAVFTSVLTVPT